MLTGVEVLKKVLESPAKQPILFVCLFLEMLRWYHSQSENEMVRELETWMDPTVTQYWNMSVRFTRYKDYQGFIKVEILEARNSDDHNISITSTNSNMFKSILCRISNMNENSCVRFFVSTRC